jgi:septin family protein
MTVVVVGNTGQGKSTMLNSLIGERNVLPTNGMRACTAALVELTYLRREREDQVAYVGEVEFISVESWEQELDVLFEELTQQDGRAILNLNNSELAGYESWCKVATPFTPFCAYWLVTVSGVARRGAVHECVLCYYGR